MPLAAGDIGRVEELHVPATGHQEPRQGDREALENRRALGVEAALAAGRRSLEQDHSPGEAARTLGLARHMAAASGLEEERRIDLGEALRIDLGEGRRIGLVVVVVVGSRNHPVVEAVVGCSSRPGEEGVL